jgi:hypothetical protein
MICSGVRACPKCGGELRYYDTVSRVKKGENGKKTYISVDRYRCTVCRSVHRELPKDILPFKQYGASVVEGFKDGTLTNDILAYEDYPCENTVNIWKSHK